MGGMLTQPVTNKRSDQGEGLGLRYGLSSMQGWRSEMEDAHDVKVGLRYGLDDWSFFAVFDGHAGKRAAAFAAWNLLDFILRDSQFELETGDSSDQKYIEPDLEKLSEALRVENSSNQPSEQSNGDKKKNETSQNTKSDEKPTEDEASEAKHNSSSQQEASLIKQDNDDSKSDERNETKAEPGELATKSKFASFPVLKQLDMVKNAIKSGFLRIDQSMRNSAQDMSGCTAVCTLISPTHLFIANCGDSRAVLYDGTSPKFVTEDHKPSHPKERQRIIDAGGCATQRINGTLAVSRALGDFEFKKDQQRGPCEQLVSPEPEVTVIERHPHDEFLILACDGIWDVMNNEDLCEFVRYKLKVEPSLENICSSVLDVCLHKGSRDNMSIIIVVFENGPKFSETERERDNKNDEILAGIAGSIDDKISDFNDFLYCIKETLNHQENQVILPPGAGIEAKYDLLHEVYEKKIEQQPELKTEE